MSCSICNGKINEENAPILAMGGMGHPRYICDECAAQIERATEGTDAEDIRAAMSAIAEKASKNDIDDGVAFTAIRDILETAKKRAEAIESGDPDLDAEATVEEFEDIPEELLESEEDKALDEREEAQRKAFDNVFTYVSAGVFAAIIIGFFIYILFLK